MAALGISILMAPAALAERVTDGLVGYWRFEETSGTTAEDRSGNGLDAILIANPKRPNLNVPGTFGSAISFVDGKPDLGGYVEVPDSPALDITGSFTLEFCGIL